MAEIHRVGRETETRALDWYLANRPCILLSKNYRYQRGEIDLIFEECGSLAYERSSEGLTLKPSIELVFVEVRYRPKLGMVTAVESVGWVKQVRMRRAADRFLASYCGQAKTVRYDLLVWDGQTWNHLPNLQLLH